MNEFKSLFSLPNATSVFIQSQMTFNSLPNKNILDFEIEIFANNMMIKYGIKDYDLPWKVRETLREKEKMMTTCVFSFSHNVF